MQIGNREHKTLTLPNIQAVAVCQDGPPQEPGIEVALHATHRASRQRKLRHFVQEQGQGDQLQHEVPREGPRLNTIRQTHR